MTDDEIREQIKAEILDGLKFETFRGARIATAICVTVLVDEGKNHAQAVCRFPIRLSRQKIPRKRGEVN